MLCCLPACLPACPCLCTYRWARLSLAASCILRIACAQIGEQCLRADLDSVSLVLALAALYKCAEKRKAVLKPDVAPFVRSASQSTVAIEFATDR